MNTPFIKYIFERLMKAPVILESIIMAIPEEDLELNEGNGTWTIREVLYHLICSEHTYWIPEINNILSDAESVEPPQENGQKWELDFKNLDGKALVGIFKESRQRNLEILDAVNIKKRHLNKLGTHPSLGNITIKEVLTAWTVHDLSHIYQILRCLCFQFRLDVGPWGKHLKILHQNY